MRAAILERINTPLKIKEISIPKPLQNQVLIKVEGCAICRTDLHIIDGDLPSPHFPLIPGHQIIGVVDTDGKRFKKGDRVGVAWLGKSCGYCFYCTNKKENLCDAPTFTGYTLNGGFAEYTLADEDFIFPINEGIEMAPLLCAGMIGYRCLKMCGDAEKIGFYGFGSAAHLLIQVAIYQNRKIYAFTRPKDKKGQNAAKKMGAVWAGDSEMSPPDKLDAAIIFATDGALIPLSLKAVRKGGIIVCAGIHMSDIPSFPYELLWGERILRSVANLSRRDGKEFLDIAYKASVKTLITKYPLEKINDAIEDVRKGHIEGSAVVVPTTPL